MKCVLAIDLDGKRICTKCLSEVLDKSECPDLILCFAKSVKVKSDWICEKCHKSGGRDECVDASYSIIIKMEGM